MNWEVWRGNPKNVPISKFKIVTCHHSAGSPTEFDEVVDISNGTDQTTNVQLGPSVGLDLFDTVLKRIDGQTRDT